MSKQPIIEVLIAPNKKVGVFKASNWWTNLILTLMVLPNDYVVGTWIEFENPEDSTKPFMEGFVTIGIFREYEDAKIIMNHYALK
jgi:hypothetical protein